MGADVRTPYKKLGAWLARASNTVYQALTDGFVCAITGSAQIVSGYTDGSNPPTTERQSNYGGAGAGQEASISMPVKKNDYWEVIPTISATVFWIPLEP